MLAARTRFGSSVMDDVPPKNNARTSARRLVAGLLPRKRACTSRMSASSSIPVRTKAMRRSSFTFTPSSFRNAFSFGVFADGSRRTRIRPCLFQKSRSNFISRSDRSYCGPAIITILMSAGTCGSLNKFSSWNLIFSFSINVFRIEIGLPVCSCCWSIPSGEGSAMEASLWPVT